MCKQQLKTNKELRRGRGHYNIRESNIRVNARNIGMNAIFLKVAVFHHFFLSSTKPYPYFVSRRAVAHRNHLKIQPLSDPNRRSQIFQSYEFGAHLKNLEMQKKRKTCKDGNEIPHFGFRNSKFEFSDSSSLSLYRYFLQQFFFKKKRIYSKTQIIHQNEFGPASTNKANFHVTLMMSAFKKLVLSDKLQLNLDNLLMKRICCLQQIWNQLRFSDPNQKGFYYCANVICTQKVLAL